MSSRKLLYGFAVLTLAAFAAAPIRADVTFTTARFKVDFPDGWQNFPVQVGGDSLLAVMNPALEAFCYMTSTTTDHPMTDAELAALIEQYAAGDSATKVTSGTRTLGGKAYAFVEYGNLDSADTASRARIYYSANGNTLFTAVLVYNTDAGAGAPDQLESALGKLTVGIRALSSRRALPTLRPADHDILGRNVPRARTPLFRLPRG